LAVGCHWFALVADCQAVGGRLPLVRLVAILAANLSAQMVYRIAVVFCKFSTLFNCH